MSKSRVLNASKILASLAQTIVGGSVVGNNLILTKNNGTTIDVGSVRGDTGPTSPSPRLFSAINTAAGSFSNNAITAVGNWTFLEGDSTLVTLSNTNFTINVSGVYVINFSLFFNGNVTGRRIAMIYKNGAEQRRQDIGSISATCVEVEHITSLAVGNILTFRGYQSSGASLGMAGSPYSQVNILKVG